MMTGHRFRKNTLTVFTACIVVGCASTPEQPVSPARITSDRAAATGCTTVGVVSDDSFKDMAKKAARMGGDLVVIFATTRGVRPRAFFPESYQIHSGEIYRCSKPEGDR
jgi:hypothetical protein